MILYRFIFILSLVLMVSCTTKQPDDKRIEQINTLLEQEKYPSALGQMEALENEGFHSGELYFNMGIAAFEAKNYTSSILYMERAKKWGYRHSGINELIETSKNQLDQHWTTRKDLMALRWLRSIRDFWGSNTWAWLAIFFAISSGIAWYVNHRWDYRKILALWKARVFLALALIAILFGFLRVDYEKNNPYAILMHKEVQLYAAPERTSEVIRTVPTGSKVKIQDKLNEWRLIILPNLEEGWVRKEVLERI